MRGKSLINDTSYHSKQQETPDHRAQRTEVRAERLVFIAEDNRHNLLRTCGTRVTYIFTAGQITVGL